MGTKQTTKWTMVQSTKSKGGVHLPGIAILATLLSVGVVAVGVSSDGGDRATSDGVGPTAKAEESTDGTEASHELSRTLEQPLANDQNVEAPADTIEVLQDFYGAEWPAAREQLLASGLDVENLPQLLPWEQASPIHRFSMRASGEYSRDVFYRRLMTWPGREFSGEVVVPDAANAQLSASSLARLTGERELSRLDEAGIERIDSSMDAANDELDRVIHKYMDALDEALAFEFDSVGFSKVPLQSPARNGADGEVYSKTASAGGWKSRISITRDRYPYVADLKAEISSLRAERKQSLSELIDALEQS